MAVKTGGHGASMSASAVQGAQHCRQRACGGYVGRFRYVVLSDWL